MKVTATTESNAQIINYWGTYNGSAYQRIALVGWISQNTTTLKTTLYTKWQIIQYNYWPYWLDNHTYTIYFGGQSRSWTFNIPQRYYNGTFDATIAQSITVSHDSTTGKYSGTLSAEGYKCWESFSEDTTVEFPDIAVPSPTPEPDPPTPTPEPEPDPPTPLEFDNDPRYYIYADGNLVYAAGVEGYYVTNPKLTLEVNKAGSLTFDIPVGSEMYNQISKLKTTVECRQGNEILFRGRLLNTKRNMMNTITCYCEGFLSWFNDMTTAPYTYNGQARDFLKQIINGYNLRASDNRKLTYVYSDISATITVSSDEYVQWWGEIKKIFIDGIGGYFVPYLTANQTGLQWLSTYGATTSQVIQFGSNLMDFEEFIDASEIFTAVRPVGKKVDGSRISLPEGFIANDDAVDRFGRIERIAIFDEITSVSVLRSSASEFLRKGIESAVTMTLKSVDLHLLNVEIERIRLGDSVRVVSVPHQIDAYFLCSKMMIDMAKPQNSVYTFGATQRTISELTNSSYNKYVITEEA